MELARSLVKNPIIATGVIAPDPRGVSENEDFTVIIRPSVISNVKG